jgi:hypothetical protein
MLLHLANVLRFAQELLFMTQSDASVQESPTDISVHHKICSYFDTWNQHYVTNPAVSQKALEELRNADDARFVRDHLSHVCFTFLIE